MAWPSSFDTFGGTAAQGTSLLSSPDHAQDHRTLGSFAGTAENIIGLGGGTPKANTFFQGIGGGSSQWGSTGTALTFASSSFNNGTLGTNLYQGGTANNETLGTPTLKSPTINGSGTFSGTIINGVYNSATFGTPQVNGGTIGSAAVLQPLNSAFWAQAGTTGQVLGTNQITQITWGSLQYDLLSEFGTSTNNFITKQAGLYQFYALLQFSGVATSIAAFIRLNGTTQQQISFLPAQTGNMFIFWQGSVAIGGTVDVAVFNNSTTNPGTMNSSQFTPSFYGKRVY